MGKLGYRPVEEPQNPHQMESLRPEQRTLLLAQRQEASSRASLATSLCILGRFEDALVINEDPERQKWIEMLIQSEALDDKARCECNYQIDRADYTRDEKAKPKLEKAAKFTKDFRHWSFKYGGVVWRHVCMVCGFSNTLPEDNINA